MRAKDAVGQYGEGLAARYLVDAGFTILERNWRCPLGEVDIVARDGDSLVICEVKTRTGTSHGTGLEAITGQKATRLRRLAAYWLEVHSVQPEAVRIEVVSVLVPPRGAPQIERVVGVA